MISVLENPVSQELFAAAKILARGSESVRAVMGSEENRFSRALADLQRLAETEAIPIAIVGGLAAIHYGYPAATQDIDIAIGRLELARFLDSAPKFGFQVVWRADSGWHTLTHGDVEINVVPEGGKARKDSPTTIPAPAEMGIERGLGYASLPAWIELKISAGRQKDRAHVVEVLKKTSDADVNSARIAITAVNGNYAVTFEQLLEDAIAERRQEEEHGGIR